ncbi:glycoside hydrolase family 44 protein [Vibrio sp. PP-XX7]
MKQILGRQKMGAQKFAYSLDNEPSLWSHTHSRIHPQMVGAKELVEIARLNWPRRLRMSIRVLQIFGPALFGFSAHVSLLGPDDWKNYSNQYHWYVDYYLDQMKTASTTAGKRLLDVLDFVLVFRSNG